MQAKPRPAPAAMFDLAAFLPYRLSMLSATWAHIADRLYQRHDLMVRDWRILLALASFSDCSAREVSEKAGYDKAGVSRSLASMEKRGLVATTRDAADSRRSIVRLTAAGRKLVGEILPHSKARETMMLEALSATERVALERILTKLQRRADEMRRAAKS